MGSDPEEWWGPDSDDVRRRFAAQLEALAGQVKMVPSHPEGYSSGDIAWVVDQPVLRTPDGNEVATRFSGVLQREGDAWKLVHIHLSLGVSNEAAIGEELPV